MQLYVYEHCPYCTKVRMIFGLKEIKYELVYLLNDDEKTPFDMIGKKMLPIIKDDDGSSMAESLDIIDYIDGIYYPSLVEKKVEDFITSWIQENINLIYNLCFPRWALSQMPEFQTYNARQYFIKKKEAVIGSFNEHLALSDDYKELLEQSWVPLLRAHEDFFTIESRPTQIGDFHLFSLLKALSIVRDFEIPSMIQTYRNRLSILSGVPLELEYARF
jgi:glutaredoxin 2